MNKYKRLFNDSVIYLVGNFGSKVVSFIMVSFYTYNLLPSEYGSADIVLTTIALILPLVTCCVHTAVLRFAMKSDYEPDKIISCGITVYSINLVLMTIICGTIYLVTKYTLIGWVIMLVSVEGLSTILLQYCRAINRIKLYATTGILQAFLVAILNIFFLKFLNLGLNGYFLSYFLAYVISIITLSGGLNIFRTYKPSLFSLSVSRELLRFSVPLIPSSLMWWAMNALDKYVILYHLGTEWNGIYAVAGKIPTILSTLSAIFIQAWQVSAIMESDSEDKDVFYSNIFEGLLFSNVICFSGLLMVIRPVLTYVISNNYVDTWRYVPFLLLSTVCSSLVSFHGAVYLAAKETRGEFVSSVIGGTLNLVLNFVLIKRIGLNGAAIATALSYFVVLLWRVKDTGKYISIQYDTKKIGIYSILLATEVAAVYLMPPMVSSCICVLTIVILVLLNKSHISALANRAKEMLR